MKRGERVRQPEGTPILFSNGMLGFKDTATFGVHNIQGHRRGRRILAEQVVRNERDPKDEEHRTSTSPHISKP
jgi:hypothetical protein